MKAIHFGAGNIGRGFIGKLLADAGYQVLFVDVSPILVEALRERGTYEVTIVGEKVRTETVHNVSALFSSDPALADEIAQCDLITTAVGPALLERIAPSIAQGLSRRAALGESRPLNVIACENMVRATTALKNFVLSHVAPQWHDYVEGHVGFADSAVDRIVPPSHNANGNPLAVTVEEFSEWIVNRHQLKAWERPVPGMELTDNLMAFVERKLFTLNTGHAMTAYLGTLYGYDTICDSIADPEIIQSVRDAMEESGEVLIRRYGFDRAKHASYIGKILLRFANPWLQDNVTRVGREPIRKLGMGDRLVRPLLGTLEYGTARDGLIKGIAAALCYQNANDPQAVDMDASLRERGMPQTLDHYASGSIPPTVLEEIEQVWLAVRSQFQDKRFGAAVMRA